MSSYIFNKNLEHEKVKASNAYHNTETKRVLTVKFDRDSKNHYVSNLKKRKDINRVIGYEQQKRHDEKIKLQEKEEKKLRYDEMLRGLDIDPDQFKGNSKKNEYERLLKKQKTLNEQVENDDSDDDDDGFKSTVQHLKTDIDSSSDSSDHENNNTNSNNNHVMLLNNQNDDEDDNESVSSSSSSDEQDNEEGYQSNIKTYNESSDNSISVSVKPFNFNTGSFDSEDEEGNTISSSSSSSEEDEEEEAAPKVSIRKQVLSMKPYELNQKITEMQREKKKEKKQKKFNAHKAAHDLKKKKKYKKEGKSFAEKKREEKRKKQHTQKRKRR